MKEGEMPEQVSKDNSRVTITEYDVREIDEYGDCQDVNSYPTLEDAKRAVVGIDMTGEIRAAVIEKHISKRPAYLYSNPDTYKTVARYGDKDALEDGGW
jgi:hypothetical protein